VGPRANIREHRPYTVEESYEVAGCHRARRHGASQDELGDLLFQVVFHARIAEEGGHFDFDAVAAAICDKLVRRHPHVSETGRQAASRER